MTNFNVNHFPFNSQRSLNYIDIESYNWSITCILKHLQLLTPSTNQFELYLTTKTISLNKNAHLEKLIPRQFHKTGPSPLEPLNLLHFRNANVESREGAL